MGFSYTFFIAIIFFLTSLAVQSFGELIVRRDPPDAESATRKLTCISDDDDDYALIWNYDYQRNANQIGQNTIEDFVSKKPTPKNVADCAIWDMIRCIAPWGNKSGWDVVNSVIKPMNPVFDYRWEGFEEMIVSREPRYVNKVNETSGIAVFSARGKRDFHIYLCANSDPRKGHCFWIILEGLEDGRSSIWSCDDGITQDDYSPSVKSCSRLARTEHELEDLLDVYEWRTFRLTWMGDKKTIQIFRDIDNENEPFLEGQVELWDPVFHILIRSDEATHVRFHYYDYFRTEKKDAKLSTPQFVLHEKNFCVKLLLGLCRDCKLKIDLIDEDNRHIFTKTISGETISASDRLLPWQSINLTVNLQKPIPKFVQLKITTILNGDKAKGQWSVDRFRMCKLVGSQRKSTIKIHRESLDPSLWPKVICQKLSHSKSTVIDALTPESNGVSLPIRTIRGIEDSRSVYSANTELESCFNIVPGKTSIIVTFYDDLESCRDQRLDYLELRLITDKYQMKDISLSSPFIFEDLAPYTEYELTAYRSIDFPSKSWIKIVSTLQSAPSRVVELKWSHLSDTRVTLQWTKPSHTNGIITKYSVSIQRLGIIGCEEIGDSTPPENATVIEVNKTTVSIVNLHPYALYEASVKAYTSEPGPKVLLEFSTNETDVPTSVVSNLKLVNGQNLLIWDKRPEDCTTISGPLGDTRLIFTSPGYSLRSWTLTKDTTSTEFSLNTIELTPYTRYRVRVYVMRKSNKRINNDLYQEKSWRTSPTAPSAPRNLQVDEADPDTNKINIRWMPPNPANGVIQTYYLELSGETGILDYRTMQVSKRMCDLWTNYVCFGLLELPPASATENITIRVYASNRDVTERGNSTSITSRPSVDYDSAPDSPSNLTWYPESPGVIMVRWLHPLSSYTKITRFEITVKFLHTFLVNDLAPNAKYPIQINYTITKRQKRYSEMLYLLPSTSYKVSVVPVNKREKKSLDTYTAVEVPTSLGFADETKPRVTFDGTLIDVELPTVVNATQYTTVKVIIKGLLTCARNQLPKSSHLENLTISQMEWDAVIYQARNNTSESLKIFVKQNHGVALNCTLHFGETYRIVFNATDWYSKTSVILTTSPITLIALSRPNLAWLAIFPVLAVCVLLLIILYSYRERIQSQFRQTSPFDMNRLSLTAPRTNHQQSLHSSNDAMPQDDLAEDRLYELPKEHDSCSVSIEIFAKYVQHSAANGRLYSQFMLLLRGLTKPCDYGKLPENMPKNRYKHLVAYDNTRVVLDKIPGDPYSDYINASYIKGYRKERVYIAAQGPQPNTVNDFWRMVWEQRVRVICMLTNVTEGTKTNCEKYWPDIGTRVKYGNFHISNVDDQVYADYTFRTFELSYKRNTRKVTHLHYTGWPITGVPTYPGSFVAYLKKLKQTPAGNSPIVVHCSTGDGRTGMIILCDICLRQAAAEKVIDVTAVITRMRDDRANMVSTLQEYLLAHIIIMESILPWHRQIACTEILPERMKRMRIQLPFDMERLDDTKWQKLALQSLSMPKPSAVENVGNDRIQNLVPATYVPFRSDLIEIEDNQINAVSVDGFKVKKRYLASWIPPPISLFNFWGFITEMKMKLIIILQCSDPRYPTCIDIMPNESIVVPMLNIKVQNKTSLDEEEYFTNEKLLLEDTSQGEARSQSVAVLTCKGWGCGKNQKPPPPATLISLWRASEKITRKKGETLVLCHDGITGCGLYLALSFLLERMIDDKECDIISAVQVVRRSEPEFVQSMEQFEYLYDAAVNYIESLQT